MKKQVKRLTLSRETVRNLNDSDLFRAAHAALGDDTQYVSCASDCTHWPNCEFTAWCGGPWITYHCV